MQVLYFTQRYEPHGALCGPPIEYHRTPGAATTALIRYELGYGGRITHLNATCINASITVRTSCLGFGNSRYDITTFSGDATAMKPLLRAVAVWAEAKNLKGKEHIDAAVETIVTHGFTTPLYVSMLGHLLFSSWVSPLLCAAANLDEKKAKSLLDLKLPAEAFDPIIELLIEGTPFDECWELAVASAGKVAV